MNVLCTTLARVYANGLEFSFFYSRLKFLKTQLYYTTRILKFLNMQLYYTTPILKCNHIILHLQVYAIQRYRRDGLKCLIEFSCFQMGLEKLQIPECCLTHLFAATMVTFHTNCCHLLQLKLCRNNV